MAPSRARDLAKADADSTDSFPKSSNAWRTPERAHGACRRVAANDRMSGKAQSRAYASAAAYSWRTRNPPPKLVTQISPLSYGFQNTRTGCTNG